MFWFITTKNVNDQVISDNGPQFVAKDFKKYIRVSGMTHVRKSPYYPQSNGKIERWHGTLKRERIRPGVLLSLEDARNVVAVHIHHYNNTHLKSAIGYIAPVDQMNGRSEEIFKERDVKLEHARQARRRKRLGKAWGSNPPRQAPLPPKSNIEGPFSEPLLDGATCGVSDRV